MTMMEWYAAGASEKQKSSGPNLKLAWQSATWSCIRRKPKSFTARTGNAKRHIRTSSLTSSGIAFGPGGSGVCGTTPCSAASTRRSAPAALKTMRSTIRDLGIRHRTQMTLADIARQINPLLRGWIEYYGRYAPSALHPVLRHVNQTLLAWARRKFKRFAAHKIRASRFLQSIAKNNAELFVHWRIGMTGTFA